MASYSAPAKAFVFCLNTWAILAIGGCSGKQRGEIATLGRSQGGIFSLAFSPDGKWVVSGGKDGTIIIWDCESLNKVATVQGHKKAVYAVAFSPDQKFLATGCYEDFTIKIWDTTTWKEVRSFKHGGEKSGVSTLAFSPDGKTLATGEANGDNSVILWDWRKGSKRFTIRRCHKTCFMHLAFSPNGTTLATVGEDDDVDGVLRLWDTKSGKAKANLKVYVNKDEGRAAGIETVAFAPDGKTIAMGCYDGKVRLWDVARKKVLRAFSQGKGNIQAVSFSPDSQLLAFGAATGNKDPGKVTICKVTEDNEVTLFDVQGGARCIAFSLNGKVLATAGIYKRGALQLWDLATLLDQK